MSFNVGRLVTGRLKRLHELLELRYHADPDPKARARADIDRLMSRAFDQLSLHYKGAKDASLRTLIKLQSEALDLYDGAATGRTKADVARLEQILKDMDTEMAKLSRKADDLAKTAPPLDLGDLGPPPAKTWDDPSLTPDEFITQYRQRYPDTPLTDKQLRGKHKAGQRLNPETGALKKPVRPLPAPEHVDLTTDPARIAQWEAYLRGGTARPCFPAGTLVHVPGGLARIETLGVGDTVIGWSEERGECAPYRIERLSRNWTRELLSIRTARGTVAATCRHPFWVDDRGAWVDAQALEIGASLRFVDGEISTVLAVDRLLAIESTYNLEVAEAHTYFVGEPGALVHNGVEDSAFTYRDARKVQIYVVRENNKVIYVGQTVHEDVIDRLAEHINDPDSALYIKRRKGSAPIDLDDPRNTFRIDSVAEGTWTPYEAAVWEQHYIDQNGGKANLRNRQDAIRPDKFDLYRNLHNPC